MDSGCVMSYRSSGISISALSITYTLRVLQVINVRFASDFHIQRSYADVLCKYDYLTVYDGANTSASKVWKYLLWIWLYATMHICNAVNHKFLQWECLIGVLFFHIARYTDYRGVSAVSTVPDISVHSVPVQYTHIRIDLIFNFVWWRTKVEETTRMLIIITAVWESGLFCRYITTRRCLYLSTWKR